MAKANNKNKYIQAAQKYVDKRAYDKAIKEYLKAHEEDPKDVNVAQKLGQLYLKNKQLPDAIKFFKIAGSIYVRDGFHQKAVAVYRQALEVDTNNYELKLEIANLYRKLGLLAEAGPHFKDALKFFEMQNQADKVLDILKCLLELEPKSVNYRIKLAEMLLKSGNKDQGYKEVAKVSEDLKSQSRLDDLEKLWEKLVKAEPTRVENLFGYADALILKNEIDRAAECYKSVLKIKPENLEALDQLASTYTRLQDTQNAVLYLKKKANIVSKAGDKNEEKNCWQKIVKLHPADEEAKTRLKQLGGTVSEPPAPKGSAPSKSKSTIIEPEEDDVLALEEADEDSGSVKKAPAPAPKAAAQPAPKSAAPPPHKKPAAPPKETIEIPPEDKVPAMLTEADLYIGYGLIEKAAQYVRNILAGYPDRYEALRLQGLIYKDQGKIKEAIASLLKAVAGAKNAGDSESAINYAKEVLGLDENNAEAQKAINELNTGVEIDIDADTEEESANEEAESQKTDDDSESLDLVGEDDTTVFLSDDVEQPDINDEIIETEVTPPPAQPKSPPPAQPKAAPVEQPLMAIEDEEEDEDRLEISSDAPILDEIEELEDDGEELELEAMADNALDEIEEEKPAPKPPQAAKPAPPKPAPVKPPVFEEEEIEEVELEADVEEQAEVFEEPQAAPPPAPKPAPKPVAKPAPPPQAAKPAPSPQAAKPAPKPAPQPMPKPVAKPPPARQIDIDDEWDDEDVAEAPAPPPPSANDIHAVADATDEAWSDAIDDEDFKERTLTDGIPEDEMSDLADEVLGEVFGEEATSDSDGGGLFDLASALSEELTDENLGINTAGDEDLGSVLSSFREKVKDQIGEDAETHFNLGIAYKEMGLFKDAIHSFQQAYKAGYSASDCISLIGLSFMDLKDYNKAEQIFREGLKMDTLEDHETLGLKFDLGQTLEKLGKPKDALQFYKEVEAGNPHFRDVNGLIKSIESKQAIPPAVGAKNPAAPQPAGGRSKISYI